MALRDNCKRTAGILKSGVKSLDEYVDLVAGDASVRYTPEYWFTANIFRGIRKNTHYIPILENSVAELREFSAEVQSGKVPHNLRLDGKTDIGIWTKSWDPVGIVEVKRGWTWDGRKFNPDLERITSALKNFGKKGNKSGSLRSGFFVIVSDKWASSRSECTDYFDLNYSSFLSNIRDTLNSHTGGPYKLLGDYEFTRYDKKFKKMGSIFVFKIS